MACVVCEPLPKHIWYTIIDEASRPDGFHVITAAFGNTDPNTYFNFAELPGFLLPHSSANTVYSIALFNWQTNHSRSKALYEQNLVVIKTWMTPE